MFGTASPPVNPGSRPRSITPPMLEALFDHLVEEPGLYIDVMVVFLHDEFNIPIMPSSLKRTLSTVGWTRKTARQRGQEQNPDLYFHKLSEYQSYQLVSVDYSGMWPSHLHGFGLSYVPDNINIKAHSSQVVPFAYGTGEGLAPKPLPR